MSLRDRLRSAPLLVGAGLLVGGAIAAARRLRRTKNDEPHRATAAFEGVNERFHAAYAGARSHAEDRAPALVVLTDVLVLCRDGAREETRFMPPSFHVIKSVAHGPLAIFALLQGGGDAALDAPKRAQLQAVRESIMNAIDKLSSSSLEGEARAHLEAVLLSSVAFTDSVLGANQSSTRALDAFARETGPTLLALTDDAAAVGLGALHEHAQKVLARLSPDERRDLQVVVTGNHQARVRSLAMQYFQRLFGEPDGAEDRVTFAEGVSNVDGALAIVGTRRLDRAIGRSFFGDPSRLQRDILGDAVEAQLDAMFAPDARSEARSDALFTRLPAGG